jgi:hypothetical protein
VPGPINESQTTHRINETQQQNHNALSIDLSENSQALIVAPETLKLKAGDKKVLRPPSSSSSSSSESDDVEVFIEEDDKIKQTQNDIQIDKQVVE